MKIQKNAEFVFQEAFLNAFKQQMNNETVLKETLIANCLSMFFPKQQKLLGCSSKFCDM